MEQLKKDRKKIAKWGLKVLLSVIFIFLILGIYKVFYVDYFFHYHSFYLKRAYWWENYLIILAMLASLYLYFLPYIISRKLYKKGKYIKQITWGIIVLIITQLFITSFFVILLGCMGCYGRKYEKERGQMKVMVPCIPNPDAGIYCDTI